LAVENLEDSTPEIEENSVYKKAIAQN